MKKLLYALSALMIVSSQTAFARYPMQTTIPTPQNPYTNCYKPAQPPVGAIASSRMCSTCGGTKSCGAACECPKKNCKACQALQNKTTVLE